jgi:hypothetical protein
MSRHVFFPRPRLAEDGSRPQPVEVAAVDSGVALGCSGCRAELRLPLEPVTPMLDAVGDFVRRHAACA